MGRRKQDSQVEVEAQVRRGEGGAKQIRGTRKGMGDRWRGGRVGGAKKATSATLPMCQNTTLNSNPPSPQELKPLGPGFNISTFGNEYPPPPPTRSRLCMPIR